MWQLSIRSKIIFTLLVTGLACLAAGAIIGYRAGETALTQSVEDRLTAQREGMPPAGSPRPAPAVYARTATFLESALDKAAAAKALITAYREMRAETQANPAATQADTVALEAWYNKDLLPRLDKVTGSHTPLEGLMPTDPAPGGAEGGA